MLSETDVKASNFLFFLKTKSQYIAQAGPVLLGSSDSRDLSNWYTSAVLTPTWARDSIKDTELKTLGPQSRSVQKS